MPASALNPRFVRLDASTACQLKCPSCPTGTGETARKIGAGYLKFEDFKEFLRRNPNVAHIELSNWGEAFLNKDLDKIFAYAYRHNVCLYIANGANLNTVRPGVPEALVKYKVRRITCSIDGASQETYSQYRVKGNFDRVIETIKEINRWKAKYRSAYPKLKWQFVAFGHNEHEITKAREMAKGLDMEFYLKLSWEDLYDLHNFSPVRDKDLIKEEIGLGVADRKEYLAKYGQAYVERACCLDMWKAPQINFDGRLLGCPINYWGDYGNSFETTVDEAVNNEKIVYARDMLTGKREAKKGIPCTTCKVYQGIRNENAWITEKERELPYWYSRKYTMLENKILGPKITAQLSFTVSQARQFAGQIRRGQVNFDLLREVFLPHDPYAVVLPNEGYPLSIPLPMEADKKWKPHFLFRGRSSRIKDFSCHVSTLVNGHSPHPPHTHKEEEILIMLSGEADVILPLYEGPLGKGRMRLRPGEFTYYPVEYPHTLQTTSAAPANYLMFKWYTPRLIQAQNTLGFGKYSIHEEFLRLDGREGFNASTLFEGSSQWLKQLHCHASILAPGASYPAHADAHDVAIIMLEGEVETLGKRFAPHSVIFHPRQTQHGISNPGPVPAKYVVFQFK